MKKPKLNKDLEVNRYGQLIQWKDGPEIVNGVKGHVAYFANKMVYSEGKFTIAKNELRGL